MSMVFRSARGLAFLRRYLRRLLPGLSPLLSLACADGSPATFSQDGAPGHLTSAQVVAANAEEIGRYLTVIGGCNDCHTDGYAESGGQMPESAWLTGSVVGLRGPWGTTYPSNLRQTVASLSEDQWVTLLGTRTALPPMPWPSVNAMSESDQRALYRFIQSLGPGGEATLAGLPPGVEPAGPWIDFVPRNLPVRTADGQE